MSDIVDEIENDKTVVRYIADRGICEIADDAKRWGGFGVFFDREDRSLRFLDNKGDRIVAVARYKGDIEVKYNSGCADKDTLHLVERFFNSYELVSGFPPQHLKEVRGILATMSPEKERICMALVTPSED